MFVIFALSLHYLYASGEREPLLPNTSQESHPLQENLEVFVENLQRLPQLSKQPEAVKSLTLKERQGDKREILRQNITLEQIDEAANRIRDEIESEANIIFGSAFDENLNGRIRVSVVATGIGGMPITSAASSNVSSFKDLSINKTSHKKESEENETSENKENNVHFLNSQENQETTEEPKVAPLEKKKASSLFERFTRMGRSPKKTSYNNRKR